MILKPVIVFYREPSRDRPVYSGEPVCTVTDNDYVVETQVDTLNKSVFRM